MKDRYLEALKLGYIDKYGTPSDNAPEWVFKLVRDMHERNRVEILEKVFEAMIKEGEDNA